MMTRVDGYQEGFDACKARVIAILKDQMGDKSAGADMEKIYDGVLCAALQRIEILHAFAADTSEVKR